MLLTAIERFIADGSLTLDIIGDGPQRPQLEALVAEKNLGGRVTFHGWVEHKKIQHVLGKCDFLALPSIREFGGAVVLEAMALGVAPVVADYGGPSELVDSETGVRIPFHDQASLIAGFARAVGEFIKTPQRLDSFGQAARKRVLAEFTWDAKAKKIVNFYDKLIM